MVLSMLAFKVAPKLLDMMTPMLRGAAHTPVPQKVIDVAFLNGANMLRANLKAISTVFGSLVATTTGYWYIQMEDLPPPTPSLFCTVMDGLKEYIPSLFDRRVYIALTSVAIIATGAIAWRCKRAVITRYRRYRGVPEIKDPEPLQIYRMESVRQDSVETPMTMPDSQVRIGTMIDGKFSVLGCAVRFRNDWLIGPDHVLCDDSEPKYGYGKVSCVKLDGERIVLATDLVGIKLSPAVFSQMGVREAKLAPITARVFAAIVGPFSKGTSGSIMEDPTIFGRMMYTGTTMPGYSGAAYTAGSAVAAIHTNGGKVNGGYASKFVWMLICEHEKIRDATVLEATDDWIYGQYRSGKEMRWTPSPYDRDEIRLYAEGSYHTIHRSVMDKAFGGTHWNDDYIIHRGGKNFRNHKGYYDDREYEDDDYYYEGVAAPDVAGEAENSNNLGGLSISKSSQGSGHRSPQTRMRELKTSLNNASAEIRRLRKIMPRPAPVTNGLLDTLTTSTTVS